MPRVGRGGGSVIGEWSARSGNCSQWRVFLSGVENIVLCFHRMPPKDFWHCALSSSSGNVSPPGSCQRVLPDPSCSPRSFHPFVSHRIYKDTKIYRIRNKMHSQPWMKNVCTMSYWPLGINFPQGDPTVFSVARKSQTFKSDFIYFVCIHMY